MKYYFVHFKPLGVLSVKSANTLPELNLELKEFSVKIGEEIQYKDNFAHSLNNGTLYQILETNLN